uniref:BTB domain-containing protein n=1 Tax=Panagrellus redivivus TaxID=6233 RepID=A0A7E5A277_PANRE
MFTHDTKEKKTGTLTIVDCEYNVIKEVIDMSYGHPMKATTVNEVLELLTFADKYEISTVLEVLSDWLANHLTVETFGTIATYAWTYSNQHLKQECCSFYKKHPHVALTAGFREIDSDVIINIIQTA